MTLQILPYILNGVANDFVDSFLNRYSANWLNEITYHFIDIHI